MLWSLEINHKNLSLGSNLSNSYESTSRDEILSKDTAKVFPSCSSCYLLQGLIMASSNNMVCGPYLVTLRNWIALFEWYVAKVKIGQ